MNSPRVAIVPYNLQSQSAINLQNSLSNSLSRRIRRLFTDERSTFNATPHVRIINWGCSSVPDRLSGGHFINRPDAVAASSNKLTTFERMNGTISIPAFTTDYATACEWVRDGKVVVCRTKLNGHSGAGIVLAAREEDVVMNCPLYVQYVKKASEFRVHVAFGNVIDVQAKRRRADFEGETDFAIRNHHTGWVYCREDIVEPETLRTQAIQAVQVMGLDFGAVDVIYNSHYNVCYVLEVNTAPGLEGTTVTKYTEAFANHLRGVA